MKFSVIVCAYNEEKYLKKCLNSLKDQNYNKDDYEIIIVDNESTDETNKISEGFIEDVNGQLKIKYFSIQHVGLSSSRNFAISKSEGDIIVFIDGDAIVDESLLKEYEIVFNTGCDYSGGKINLLNKDNYIANLLQNTKYKQIFNGYNKKNLLHGANMAFSKEIFDKFKFIENFYSRGDDSSFIALVSNKYLFKSSKKSIVYHERPESFSEWINILKVEFDLSYKVHTLVNQSLNKNSYLFQKSLFGNLIIICFLIFSFINIYFFIFFTLILIFIKKRHFDLTLNLKETSFALLNLFINIFFTPPLYLLSYLKYKSEKLIKNIKIVIIKSIVS